MLSAQHMPAQTTMLHARPPQQPCPQHTQLVPTHTPSYQAPAALQINLLSLGHQANTADMPSCDTNHALRSAYHPFLCTSCSTHTHVQHDRGSHYCCQGKQAVSLFSCAACTATASCLHTQCDSPHHQQHFFSCLASAPQQTVLTLGNPQPIPQPSTQTHPTTIVQTMLQPPLSQRQPNKLAASVSAANVYLLHSDLLQYCISIPSC
jgi:hypothetical protein